MMANNYLTREGAPFGEDLWKLIDDIMIKAARGVLVGRRILPVEGPLGFGFKSIPAPDERLSDNISLSHSIPLLHIFKNFFLNKRDLASFEQGGIMPDPTIIWRAAISAAQVEDQLVFNGNKASVGLTSSKESHKHKLSPWDEVGTAANDIISALTKLDSSGFHGPYCLALSPGRYNLLYRQYPGGQTTEIEHARIMAANGVFKAPELKTGGVLLDTTVRPAVIFLGQDMQAGFQGPVDEKLELSISESIALRIYVPQAICVLEE